MSRWIFPAALAAIALTGCDASPLGASLASRESRDIQAAAMVRRAVDDMGSGDSATGRSRIDGAVALLGRDTRARAEIARQLVELGRPDAAERLLLPLLDDRANAGVGPLAWGILAMAASKKGDRGTEARARARAEAAATAEIARFGARPRDDQGRAEAIRRLLDLADYHALPLIAQPRQEIAACREAVAVARQSPLCRSRLARALADHATTAAERDEAVQNALEAIQYANEQGGFADEAALKDIYGWALAQRGRDVDVDGARRVLREAADIDPENASIRYHLGMAFIRDGLGDRAMVELNRALMLRPDYPEAESARRELERLIPEPAPSPRPSPKPAPAARS